MILTYADQLEMYAHEERVDIRKAIAVAGVPRSTYHRSIIGNHQLRLDTAEKIFDAITQISRSLPATDASA